MSYHRIDLDAEFQGILASIAEEVDSIRSTAASDPVATVEQAAELGVRLVASILLGRDRESMGPPRGFYGGVAQHLNAIRHILLRAWDDASLRRAFSALQPHAVRLGDVCGASWHEVAVHVVGSVRNAVLYGMPDDDTAHLGLLVDAVFRRGDWFPDAADIADYWEDICEHLPGLNGADCEALQISLRKERTQRISRSVLDSKLDSKKNSDGNIPQNKLVYELIRRLNKAHWPKGKKREIAREMTDGDTKKADDLLTQVERFPNLHKNRPPKK